MEYKSLETEKKERVEAMGEERKRSREGSKQTMKKINTDEKRSTERQKKRQRKKN